MDDRTTPAEMMLAHRYRFVAPACAGRVVMDEAGADAHRGLLGSASRMLGPDAVSPEVLVCLAARTAADRLAGLPALIAKLPADGILLVAVAGGADEAIETLLAERFATVEIYVQRPALGSLIAASRFAGSRVTALIDAAPAAKRDEEAVAIVVSGPSTCALATGLFESALAPKAPLPRLAPLRQQRIPRMDATPPNAPDAPRAHAVSLVERLMDLDETMIALAAENRALRKRSSGGSVAAQTGALEIDLDPTPPQSWPLADNPAMAIEALGGYERRPDDDLIGAARDGDAFLAAHALLDPQAEFSAAVAALNALRPALALATPEAAAEVSIVIPVHGQLAYTLNCLDGLLRHESAHRVEIIVVDDRSPDETSVILAGVNHVRVHENTGDSGFIAACNAGAALASGRFIVLLNNDTRPLPGWLDALIGSFALFPRAGIVGSKLLYPNGTLQEAGGIVWRNGRGWNYGRDDDPNRPCYCHARQADYVSAASIAIPIGLWRELGGLDPYYAPAYYEDTDLAFRAREAGFEVWYQPVSRVIHYEGRTSGTVLASGVKAFQTVNEGRFFYRWRNTLRSHRIAQGQAALERERRVTQRALLLDDTTPTPRQDAGSNYSLLTMRLFVALGYKLSFVPQDNFLFQPGHTTDLQRIGVECAYEPYDHDAEGYLHQYGRLFDVVMVSRLQVLERVIDDLARFAPQAPIVFNVHELTFLRMRHAAELTGDAALAMEAETMRDRAFELMRRVDCVITPSAFEGEMLARELPDIPVRVLPILTDLEGTDIGFEGRRDVVFLGGYGHPPNIDAVKFFLDEIFPLLKAEEPALRFIIAGANPTPELLALAGADIVVTGMIDDLRDVLDAARVFVCPLRIGAGAKGKIASAMSYGLPIVSTSIGAEGMGLTDGATVLVADAPADFAKACLRIYRDRALWERISTASMELVAQATSDSVRRHIFTEAIDAALRRKHGVPA